MGARKESAYTLVDQDGNRQTVHYSLRESLIMKTGRIAKENKRISNMRTFMPGREPDRASFKRQKRKNPYCQL